LLFGHAHLQGPRPDAATPGTPGTTSCSTTVPAGSRAGVVPLVTSSARSHSSGSELSGIRHTPHNRVNKIWEATSQLLFLRLRGNIPYAAELASSTIAVPALPSFVDGALRVTHASQAPWSPSGERTSLDPAT
jgi:hypothetical protein